MKPTLGSDPELVAIADTTDILHQYGFPDDLLGLPVPAYFAMGVQDVENPGIQLPKGTLTPDGMAAEFTVVPTDSVEEMVENLRLNLRALKAFFTPRGIKLGVEPYFHTDPRYIDRLPESFGKACSLQILGCAPDFCAYPSVELPDRPDPRTYPFRTSGGHIHVGVGTKILTDNALLCYTIAAMDNVLGTAATFLCNTPQAFQRKVLYGSAGMARENMERGTFEYRTLPAQALVQTEDLARMMFTAAQEVCGHIMDVVDAEPQPSAIKYLMEKFGTYGDIVSTLVPAINTHDVDKCRALQSAAGDRLSECATITAVINDLQAYRMPTTFDLQWD